ncbi:alpha/beta hydrolase [Amycolatopsis solani]|uniref:alpha/beta hydrolase n=1 Tax=Amycolatopsis solani TaxID=3028615 RepID=UPI0025AF54F7|nr:alpha/beta hydrolase [Amycolatopsis sp. MEP2-6]
MKTATAIVGETASEVVALALTASQVPTRFIRKCWTGTVLESAAGHSVTGVADGMFGAHLSILGQDDRGGMTIRAGRRTVAPDRRSLAAAFPRATGTLVVFLHGLVETERSWFRGSGSPADFGTRLVEDLDVTPVYVRYNSGRHVAENGDDLVTLISQLVDAWPVPVADIILVGHSMGGLVARSALHQAPTRRVPWLSRVTRLVCLGTPHVGAPLERNVARLAGLLSRSPLTAPLTRLLAMRSNGIKDLAHGHVHHQPADHDPPNPVRPAPPARLRRLFVSATLSRTEGSRWGRVLGDLLVAPVTAADLEEDAEVVWLGGLNHFALLHADAVYRTIVDWLRVNRPPSGRNTRTTGRSTDSRRSRVAGISRENR